MGEAKCLGRATQPAVPRVLGLPVDPPSLKRGRRVRPFTAYPALASLKYNEICRYGAHFAGLEADTIYTVTVGELTRIWSTSNADPALHELVITGDR